MVVPSSSSSPPPHIPRLGSLIHSSRNASDATGTRTTPVDNDTRSRILLPEISVATTTTTPSISCDSSCSSNDSSLTLSVSSVDFVFAATEAPPSLNRNHSGGHLVNRRSRSYTHSRALLSTSLVWEDNHHQDLSPSRSSRRSARPCSGDSSYSGHDVMNVSFKFGGVGRVIKTRSVVGVFFLGGFFFSGIWAGCYFLFHRYLSAHDEALKQRMRETEFIPITTDMEKKLFMLEKDNKYLQDQLISSENQRVALVKAGADPRLHQQLRLLDKQKNRYRASVQKLSQYAMMERFGPSPHHVEMQLAFDPKSSTSGKPPSSKRIVVELATAAEMPHTVFWFLEQVTRGLYDGTSFHRSAPHVIQGGPATNFLTPLGGGANSYQRFKRSGFDSVLIQEYNPEKWTHQPYTIGFPGRPGGPDFYFNLKDNAKIHGPGGQHPSNEEDPTLADPCFGKVIAGFDLIDYINQLPVQESGPYYHALQSNVAIVSMRLLDKNEPSLLQIQQQQQQQSKPPVDASPRAKGPPPLLPHEQ